MVPVVAAIKARAESNALCPALITQRRIITYGEVLDFLARISNHFADRRIPRLAKVFLNVADPDLRLIVTLACLHYGLIPFVVLNPTEEIDHDLVISSDQPQHKDLPPDLVIDQTVLAGRLSDGKLREFPDRGPDDLLFVGSSTGTTGRPKLVAEPYGRFISKGAIRRERGDPFKRVADGDRLLNTIGELSRTGFSTSLAALSAGATQVRASRDLAETLMSINLFGVTAISTTPDTMVALLDRMEALRVRCPSVRRVQMSGSLLAPRLLQRTEGVFDAAAIRVGYGTSEVGAISNGSVRSADFREGYVGELWPHVIVASTGTRAEPGPIVLANQGLIAPRYSRGQLFPETTPTYRLPDLGYLEGTSLYLVGRDDEVFNLEGDKTAFSTIETDLRAEPGVRDVGIVGGALVGEYGIIVVGVVGPGLDLAALVERVCRTLKAPGAGGRVKLMAMETIPRNAGGKVDRQAMAAAYRASLGAH